jgi:ubiquinone/menaquinone biosynthesis C-methylase UbiE
MFQKYIDGQYRQPTGVVGRWIGGKMSQQHRPENIWTVKLLVVQPEDHVLEVGFGPGVAIQEVARLATCGFVAGIDFSKTMVSAARARNADGIRAKRIDLRLGDAANLPFEANTFNKAYSIHSIYFWPDPERALSELWRALKPTGMLVITVLPREKWNPLNPDPPVGTPQCKAYSGNELQMLLAQVGFVSTKIEKDADTEPPSNYSVIGYK